MFEPGIKLCEIGKALNLTLINVNEDMHYKFRNLQNDKLSRLNQRK